MEPLNRFYFKERWKFRVVFHGVGALAFIVLIFHRDSFQNPVSRKPYVLLSGKIGVDGEVIGSRDSTICTGIYGYEGYDSKCGYLKQNPDCDSGGILNYIKFFYCDLEKYTALRHLILGIWLVTLFYLLGNTAADYFCSCLENLSNLLRLSPTLAGVTLLPLGNGAPDVFSSVAAFVGPDSGGVGLNGVLGGAVFVTSVVVGTVCLCVAERGGVRIDKKCFVRDVCFFLFASLSLLLILILGEVSVGGAIAFLSIYLVYAVCVAAIELFRRLKFDSVAPLVAPILPLKHEDSLCAALLQSDSDSDSAKLWAMAKVDPKESLWGWNDENVVVGEAPPSSPCSKLLLNLVQVPLMLPRRLTIPIVDAQRWSKTYAVASAFLAPLLLAFLWNARYDYMGGEILYVSGAVVGGIFGILALIFTSPDHPPETFLFPWILGGFFMSIVWFYILANELVALLVAFGIIFGINPSLLALTVLAWGNSLGDLISNVAMAMKSKDGIQIAISGCYAGPMFNTLVGLGLSLVIGACSGGPSAYTIPQDASLFYTLGFLVGALVFALVVLLRTDMRPNRFLGLGLMTLYLVFLFVRASLALGDGSVTPGPS
ncbi:unnamed protein product [Cuscuta campestris]|uniref:Sodium/calcium exchanger membrane region domain-containing protein n=2 Tax=Cuscuta sect. Cleistogrammica TaxID=1824901 RepID=A0A484KW16_9ASTE|nr:hypothetical protein DM860_005509 [Cuscuta australis]VFQ68154.1 unnamed protein product [Cuscuta campestris]